MQTTTVPGALEIGEAQKPILYTVEEASKVLRISQSHLRHLLMRGAIRNVTRIGRAVRISREALSAYIEDNTSDR